MHIVEDYSDLYNNAIIVRLYVEIDIVLTCGTHLHDRIISLRGGWTHKTSLSLPLFIEVPTLHLKDFKTTNVHKLTLFFLPII
jgi:hypothetical protein